MVKFADLSMGTFNRLTELLARRIGSGLDDTTRALSREYIAYRVGFLALETEIFAAFQDPAIITGYLALVGTAKTLSDMVASGEPSLDRESFEPIQDGFLAQRKRCLARMVTEMGFMTRSELQKAEDYLKPKKS